MLVAAVFPTRIWGSCSSVQLMDASQSASPCLAVFWLLLCHSALGRNRQHFPAAGLALNGSDCFSLQS